VKVKFIKCTTLSMVLGLTFASAHADVVFRDKLEAYSLAGFGTAQEGWSITNSVIRSGNYACVQTLRPIVSTAQPPPSATGLITPAIITRNDGSGGKYSVGGKGRQRNESNLGKAGRLQHGRFYDIQFSNRVSNPNTGSFVFNIHKDRHPNDRTGGFQPVGLHTRNGNWVVSVFSNSNKGKHFNLGPIDTSRYTDWEFKVKLSTKTDGHLEVYKDGKQALRYDGPNAFDNKPGSKGDYVKFGAYRPLRAHGSGGQTAYYDRISVSSDDKARDSSVDGGKRHKHR
jgi:hypothetical protein